jgi:hypothetical protein
MLEHRLELHGERTVREQCQLVVSTPIREQNVKTAMRIQLASGPDGGCKIRVTGNKDCGVTLSLGEHFEQLGSNGDVGFLFLVSLVLLRCRNRISSL